jgi:hypothetical protein
MSYVPFALSMLFVGLPLVFAAAYAMCEAPARVRTDTWDLPIVALGTMGIVTAQSFAKIYSDVWNRRNPFKWLLADKPPAPFQPGNTAVITYIKRVKHSKER